jgi:hypothetical protein
MWATCASTVLGDRYTCPEIAWFDRALGHKGKDLSLARRQLLDATAGSSPAQQRRHDLRVEDRASPGHPADRVGELGNV